jgi:23S rRNA pseudouridine1911/1915/1917 synthase
MEIQKLIEHNNVITIQIPEGSAFSRIDAALTALLPSYSRSFFQHIIKEGYLTLNGKQLAKPSYPVKSQDIMVITFPPKRAIAPTAVIEMVKNKNLDIETVYENDHFLIIYKPDNIMVHAPSERSMAVTLVDWLLVNYPDISHVGYSDRPGIVHRLDKDTSGLLVVPRTPYAHAAFSKMFQERTIHKTYLAVVEGLPDPTGTIDIPIGRSPQGNKMAAFPEYHSLTTSGAPTRLQTPRATRRIRHAMTLYTVKQYFENNALIEATIVTGRTHQIRVHCAAIGHSIVGDPVYGKKSKFIKRQALHAYQLSFIFDGKEYNFSKEAPQDFQNLLTVLQKNSQKNS